MKIIALALSAAVLPFLVATPANAATGKAMDVKAATQAIQADEISARKKQARKTPRHYRHAHRHYRYSYGYDRPYRGGYYGQGYYRGVRPGWGYGPDPGDYAWPPFHFKPYW